MFKTNEYFDGKVKSIAFTSTTASDTLPATVGVMAVGDYVFKETLIKGSSRHTGVGRYPSLL